MNPAIGLRYKISVIDLNPFLGQQLEAANKQHGRMPLAALKFTQAATWCSSDSQPGLYTFSAEGVAADGFGL